MPEQVDALFMTRRTEGFTLLEIIAVLILIGIVTLVVVSAISGGKENLVGRTEALKSHIRYAQNMAMSTDDRNWGIRFQISNDRYWLFYCNRGDSCNWNQNRTPIPGTDGDQQNRIRLSDSGIDITGINQGGNQFTLAFDNFGTPYWGDQNHVLENLLNSALYITLQDQGGQSETISVTPTTGFIP